MSADPGSLGHVATSVKEVFGTPLIFDDFFVKASENFSKQTSKSMSAAEHFSGRYNTSAVPGPDGQAASSATTVPGPHGWAAS